MITFTQTQPGKPKLYTIHELLPGDTVVIDGADTSPYLVIACSGEHFKREDAKKMLVALYSDAHHIHTIGTTRTDRCFRRVDLFVTVELR